MFIDTSINSVSTLSEVEWVDTHAHLNFPAFDKDREEVIKNCLKNNIWMVNIGTNYETSKKAVEIAQRYERGVYSVIGLHPINLDTGLVKIKTDKLEGSYFEEEFDFEKYKNLAQSERAIAIGEIGLDYYWKPKTTKKKELFKQKQKELFLEELKLAEELNLPVIFHCRMAHDDLIKILSTADILNDRSKYQQVRGAMHGFVGTIGQLKEYLKMGLYIGFNGIIFKKILGINFEELIKETPLEKILIETDCPYLAPPIGVNQRTYQPARQSLARPPASSLAGEVGREADRPMAGGRESASTIRNEPLNVKCVAEKIAQIKNLNFDKVAEITTKNARELFRI